MKPSWNDTRTARRMMRRRFPIEVIATSFADKYTPEELTLAVADMRARERANTASLRQHRCLPASAIESRSDVSIPAHVIADRKHRLSLVPRDCTALRMGDPLPGCSMLERSPSIAPSIHRDPLDGLMFKRRKTGARYG